MRPLTKLILLPLLILALLPHTARAHDVLSSTLNIWVRPSGMDAELYMARAAAGMLIPKDNQPTAISPENLSALKSVAPQTFQLTAEDGTLLTPDSASVSVTEENDILFNLHFPLPAAMPGTLKIHATYLTQMAEGHVGNAFVMNAKGDDFGFGEIRPESPDLLAHLPAATALPLPATPPASATTTAPSAPVSLAVDVWVTPGTPISGWIWLLLAAGGVFAALCVLLLVLLLTKKSPAKKGPSLE